MRILTGEYLGPDLFVILLSLLLSLAHTWFENAQPQTQASLYNLII